MSLTIARRHFTVSEFYRMAEAGILTEDARVELIEGEIIEKCAIDSHHAACVKRLHTFISRLIGDDIIIGVQDPIRLDDYSEPQPDLALLKASDDFYAAHHPGPSDVLLVVEVSDTSLGYDREVKAPLYAVAGIPEVWVVDLQQAAITRYAKPNAGMYQDTAIFDRTESIISLTVPALSLSVGDILG